MTIRSLLEHVGLGTTGRDIYVGDRLVDPAPLTAIGDPMNDQQLAIPAVESLVERRAARRRPAKTFQPPTYGDFAVATVQAFDQSLNNTGVVILRSYGTGITLLATGMIRPFADTAKLQSWEGNYARAQDIHDGIVYHRTGYGSMVDDIVYERPPVHGKRTESIILAGREVHRATSGKAVMVDNRHAKKLLIGHPGSKARPVTKAHVKEAVERYITPPEASGKTMPWNEHVRDACMLALAWLLDEKERQDQAAVVALADAA
ncbi:hypothetical protein ACPCSE_29935 [Streptomyces cellulosae]